MSRFEKIIFGFYFSLFLLSADIALSQATFIPNMGQWQGDFNFKTELNKGAIFFTEDGFTAVLQQEPQGENHAHHAHLHSEIVNSVALKMNWVNSNVDELIPQKKLSRYHNYFLGNDSAKWRAKVPVYNGITYKNLYPGINVVYHESEGSLKYDIVLQPNADPSPIQMSYEGIKDLRLEDGKLHINTGIGHLMEWIPEAYQIINGQKVTIKCKYILRDNKVSFKLGRYDDDHVLVIDPILIFSSFTGSVANNFGFTATYGHDGSFYGGGIVRSQGYPISTGVFQTAFGGGFTDVAISKFSPDGSQLLYATYLGGDSADLPHSLIVDVNNNLYILGNTGSEDFPVSASAYQNTYISGDIIDMEITEFKDGSNLFITKLNSAGTSLLASTYFGGSVGEGINRDIFLNYGDNSRGEIIVLTNGNIALTSSSLSKDLPISTNGLNLQSSGQNAIVLVFDPNLSQLVWGSYFGGTNDETGYSIKSFGNSIYISGATNSSDLPGTSGAAKSSHTGLLDGYIAKFRLTDGLFEECTYLGSTANDQSFIISIDKLGAVYTFGQTQGSMSATTGKYANPGSRQFIQKYSGDLSTLLWQTVIGSGGPKSDLVPTAFLVDQCFNIYASGWNGEINEPAGSFINNNTHDLPLSANAFQTTTDGSDFYFMVLERDAQSLLYGSYFGGTSSEHVDGGTSRFNPKGIIYQAVCAACYNGTFPTTPGSYSPTKPNINCNLGAIKMDFQQSVRSLPLIDINGGNDTICNSLHVTFDNQSISANKYFWDFGNGLTSTLAQPSTVYNTFGTYTVTLIAEDTVCDMADTNTIEVVHTKGESPTAAFEALYAGCDQQYEVTFTNKSDGANMCIWDFGDGTSSTDFDPVHFYSDTGTYTVMMIAVDTSCNASDTLYSTVTFVDTVTLPTVYAGYDECKNGHLNVEFENDRERFIYHWQYKNKSIYARDPQIVFERPGYYTINLEMHDTVCNRKYSREFSINVNSIHREIYIPNAFSPNDDGLNEYFQPFGENCKDGDYLKIYNRWGELVFETQHPFETFWDGTFKNTDVQQGVYTYILKSGEDFHRGYFTLFR